MDASSLALGAAVKIDSSIVEDASWLHKDDSSHINMAKLDAVIKGLNLALAWKIRTVELMTDSSTVHRWISDSLSGRSRLKTKAAIVIVMWGRKMCQATKAIWHYWGSRVG